VTGWTEDAEVQNVAAHRTQPEAAVSGVDVDASHARRYVERHIRPLVYAESESTGERQRDGRLWRFDADHGGHGLIVGDAGVADGYADANSRGTAADGCSLPWRRR
jgi:hypothetical protein